MNEMTIRLGLHIPESGQRFALVTQEDAARHRYAALNAEGLLYI
jgi:hypothetical protein